MVGNASPCCQNKKAPIPLINRSKTLKALRRRSPGIPVIFASGYSEAQILEENHEEMPDIYLEKPFQFAKLRHALADVLAQKNEERGLARGTGAGQNP